MKEALALAGTDIVAGVIIDGPGAATAAGGFHAVDHFHGSAKRHLTVADQGKASTINHVTALELFCPISHAGCAW